MSPRAIAIKIVSQILLNKGSLTTLLAEIPKNTNQLPFIQELCYSTFRWHSTLQWLSRQLLTNPKRRLDPMIQAAILAGLAELRYLRTPNYAVVTEIVQAVRLLGKQAFAALVNAVLRNYLREYYRLEQQLFLDEAAVYAHPDWLLLRLKTLWPDFAAQIMRANNQHPPFFLRVNRLHNSKDDYLLRLKEQGIAAKAIPAMESAIHIKTPVPVHALPGFAAGDVSVQDISAQLAAPLLELQPNLRVLDACAAPGGKTTHILELMPNLQTLIAIDKEANRVKRLQESVARIGGIAQVLTADVREIAKYQLGSFDRILLDAPCSATGVIRRHPEIKYQRTLKEIAQLVELQQQLLRTLIAMLTPKGMLLYVTCSILPEENEQQIATLLKAYPNLQERPINANWGEPRLFGRQILPHCESGDGFYFARIVRAE